MPDLFYQSKIINNKIIITDKFNNKNYSLEELNSLIIKNIIYKAEKQTQTKIKDVVVSIPAHFNQYQRESTLQSIEIAGVKCLRIINEPTAAAISYGLHMHNDVNIFIFDLGGGTLDLSILNIDDGIFEVIATYGDNDIGGELFTRKILEYIINNFKKKNNIKEIEIQIKNKNLLKQKCEFIKKNMNEIDQHLIYIPKFYNDIDLKVTINNNDINSLFNNLFNKIKEYLQNILLMANLRKNDMDYIILVGGATKLKSLQFIIESFFQKKTICNINPDHVVSMGCAIQAFYYK